MGVIKLKTSNDERLRVYTALTERQLRDNLEDKGGILIAESEKVIRVALREGLQPLSLLIDESQLETRRNLVDTFLSCSVGAEINEQAGHLEFVEAPMPVYVLPHQELSRLVGYNVTRGIHAVFRRPEQKSVSKLLQDTPCMRRLAVLDGITDATNVGAAIRSAAALNVDAVLLTPTCCDPLVRRAVRVSMGTVFQVPWARFDEWPKGMRELKTAGFTVAALALKDNSYALGDPALYTYEKLALVFGTEGDGLATSTIESCDLTIKIPMSHGVDSLNVAAATAVAFWDLCR